MYLFVEMIGRIRKTGEWYKRNDKISGEYFGEWDPNVSGD